MTERNDPRKNPHYWEDVATEEDRRRRPGAFGLMTVFAWGVWVLIALTALALIGGFVYDLASR